MPTLVALDLPAGPGFVDRLRQIWDDHDAALPVDPRLPAAARGPLLAALGAGGPVEPGDALVVPTSGTTGEPKGVVLTHDAVAAHARAVHAHLDVDPARDRWLACLPLAHVGGLGVVTRAIVDGVPLEVQPGFDVDAVRRAVAAGTTLVSLVPTALDRIDPAWFRWVVLGGSADWSHRPANVVHTYGMTESGGGVVYDGRALGGVEVAVDDDGEIRLRGPVLARAYRDGRPVSDADGWFRTGDLGRLTADGRLEVAGRRDELIVTGGENVWPTAVETALASHPAVAQVAVAGRADAEWGQTVVAFVVPTRAAEPPTLDALRAHAKATLPAYAAPRALVLVESLPRTALGKVRREQLR